MAVEWEWDVEDYDHDELAEDPQDGDVLDHHHEDRLADFPADLLAEAIRRNGKRLVLVRTARSRATRGFRKGEEVVDRTWAYVVLGRLPAYLTSDGGNDEDGTPVPARFARELERRLKEIAR